MDPNVQKMIERSRARSSAKKGGTRIDPMGKLSPRKISIDTEPRNPLKPRNFDGLSPIKGSPKKAELPASPSDTIKRLLSRESLETSVKDLLARDSPGKTIKTHTYSSSTSSPSRTTITKTVVTETEERYEKKETISVSGNKKFLQEFDNGKVEDQLKKVESAFNETRRIEPQSKPYSGKNNSTPGKETETLPEDTDYFAARKARLANLANKFKAMDEQSPIRSPVRSTSPEKKSDNSRTRSPIRTISINSERDDSLASPMRLAFNRSVSPSKIVTNITARPYVSPTKSSTASPVKAPSPDKPSGAYKYKKPDDESFISSLKAQGFTETESASRLVYDFQERQRSPSPAKSPVRQISARQEKQDETRGSVDETRSKFEQARGRTAETRGRAPVKTTVLSSPTKTAVSATRSVSPSKPHPLQFVSPQVAAQAAASCVPPPPPKPSRTFDINPAPVAKSWITKAKVDDKASDAKSDDRCDTPVRKTMSEKRHMFENQTPEVEPVDPAMMSMSDRKKLFEKNRSIPTPIARFGESVTPAMLSKARPAVETMTPAEAWKRKRELSPVKNQPPAKKQSPESYVNSGAKPKLVQDTRRPNPDQSPATPQAGRKATEIHKKLFEKKDWRENDIARKVQENKEKEMDLLLNRYNHLKSSTDGETSSPAPKPAPKTAPKPQKNKESPEKYYPGLSSLKKIKVSPPKAGGLYPELAYESDTMSSRSESVMSRPDSVMSSDTLNSSFESIGTITSEASSLGGAIISASRKSVVPDLKTIPESNDSMNTEEGDDLSESAVMDEIDDMLEEAMDDSNYEGSVDYSPHKPKGSSSSSGSSNVGRSESTTSWEFHTPQAKQPQREDNSRFKTPLVLARDSPNKEPRVQIEGAEGPMLHTVSFYRKQRPANPPVQRIVLNPVLEQTVVAAESPRRTISQKIKVLQEEAQSQMSVISQASSALNLCRSTKEFFGSSEQVEGERLLLVATHKRTAALNEISKLKTEGGLGVQDDEDTSVRGTVSLNSISLGLKKDFVNQLRSGDADDFVHYFLCLVKCAGQVIPTMMVSTLEGLDGKTLDFPNLIKLTDLPKNFVIQLEVYGLQTKREILDHDAKYHIKKEKSVFSLTPKLKLNKESRLTRPEMCSPGGPQAVRTSSFAMVGNTIITIENLKRKDWVLESVPNISPLDGAMRFQLNCHSESQVAYRGFLTMFDDVSGFGAWHRRWFVLDGNRLSYWKYPENQNTQEPIGTIDLGGCITQSVTIAPREICSRMHTFLLESRRPARTSDRESLVLVRQGTWTIIRHLLSSDSREERLTWCSILNQALDNLRAWDPQSKYRTGSVSSTDSMSGASSTSTEIW